MKDLFQERETKRERDRKEIKKERERFKKERQIEREREREEEIIKSSQICQLKKVNFSMLIKEVEEVVDVDEDGDED